MGIINMQMHHYLHNGKGYRALHQIKAYMYVVCGFQPDIKLNFRFFAKYITFSQSGSQILILGAFPLHRMHLEEPTVSSLRLSLCKRAISHIEIAVSMRIDLKKWVPLRTRICEKSMGGGGGGQFFLGDKLLVFMYYDNIMENFSLKLIRS